DGIRDRNVTGVQTCALPIYPYIRHQEIRRVFPVKGNRLPPASARGHNSVSGTFQYRPEGINNQCIVIYYYYIHLFDALLVKRNMDRKSTVMECVEYPAVFRYDFPHGQKPHAFVLLRFPAAVIFYGECKKIILFLDENIHL